MTRSLKTLGALTCLASLFAYACSADESSGLTGGDTNGPSTVTGGPGGAGGNDSGPTTISSGEGGSVFTTSSSGGSTGQGGSCVDLEFEAEFVKRPSDIIFVIDNSGSMSDEIQGVEDNINVNFANIIQSSGIDYRVIMVTDHGDSSLDVCVTTPLSGTTASGCNQAPVEVPGQFYHYDINVQSTDGACLMLDTLYGSDSGGEADESGNHPAGWAQFLRPEAVKVFVMVTDDAMRCQWSGPGSVSTSSCDATPSNPNPAAQKNCFNDEQSTDPSSQTSPAAWAAKNLRDKLVQTAPAQFGSPNGGQNFLWYSIVNMPEKMNPAEAYEPFEPLGTTKCDSTWGLGTGYQWLSIGTDSLRFPICAFQSYDAVFQSIAAGVEEGTAIPCEFTIPETEDPIADDTWVVEYAPGNGDPTEEFDLVTSAGACQGDDEFYVDGDTLKLCPLACDKVSSDSGADINVIARCAGTID